MIRAAVALALLATPAAAFELRLPNTARLTVERNTGPDSYAAPVGVFSAGQVPLLPVEGRVRRAAWKLEAPGLTPLQVIRPLREQLKEAGFEVVLDCGAARCGGFDFRFAVETLPGPNMYVNIRAYRFVTALRKEGDETAEVVTLLASTSATSAYVQIIQAGDLSAGRAKVKTTERVPVNTNTLVTDDLSAQLVGQGHVVLNGLRFKTGSSDLGQGPFADLATLAEFLQAQPALRVALVGHTDSVGSLDGNIALSRRRAQSVRRRLIEAYGVDGGRMDAQGMGYLAPVASNLEEDGREKNRRVEVILLSVR